MRKYGRTYHLPLSPGLTKDDRVIKDLSVLQSAPEIIVTEKMDGENTTIHPHGCHPRSPDARYHPSRDWIKAFAAGISPSLAEDKRIIGEYLFAQHSIAHSNLPSYFLGFAWMRGAMVQSWDATIARFAELGITPVPVLYRGAYSEAEIVAFIKSLDLETQEGFVMRDASPFAEDQPSRLAKYVRAGHVQSDSHWTAGAWEKNRLALG